jgi:dihydroorotase
MLLLLKNTTICDGTGLQEPQDLLIRDGVIEAIGPQIEPPPHCEIWDVPNQYVSLGWMDLGTHTGDPGHEHREDLASVARAAIQGGFTRLACFPNTHPALHAKSEVLYVQQKSTILPTTVQAIGAISQSCEGKDLAELFDMHSAGALAFSDGEKPVQDAGLLLRALQYVKAFNGLIINEPHHKSIAAGGQMHEGRRSTMLGLKGIPALAEVLMVQRDLSLLEYADSRLLIHLVSTARSVALIRAAKKAGLAVTCSVAVTNLCFTDERLADFDSHWKVQPPLRDEADRKALLDGLADGTIDLICSNHTPCDVESKNLEFTYADFGMIGLETAFALCRTYCGDDLSVIDWVKKAAIMPRSVLGLDVPAIRVGTAAELTVFSPDTHWTFQPEHIGSKSNNTPFVGSELKGKVIGVVNKGAMVRTVG